MNWRRLLWLDRRGLIGLGICAIPAAACADPGLLPWGWHGRIGRFDVYAVSPPAPRLAAELARADRLLATSPINDQSVHPTLYLTDGGWRWNLLAMTMANGFGITRALGSGSILNRSDVTTDSIYARGYRRTLSGVIAHETTHVMQRRKLGTIGDISLSPWVREGYADYVAQESTLDDAAVARLQAQGRSDPAIFYHDARKRVALALAGGESVDQLLGRTD